MYGGSCFGGGGRLETFGKSITLAKNLRPTMGSAAMCSRGAEINHRGFAGVTMGAH